MTDRGAHRELKRAVMALNPASFPMYYGPEFVGKAVQEWIGAVGAKTDYIAPGSPWENGYIEGFSARLRDELLDGGIFYTLKNAKIAIESWRRHHNAARPRASLGYRAPAPEVIVPALAAGAEADCELTFNLEHSVGLITPTLLGPSRHTASRRRICAACN